MSIMDDMTALRASLGLLPIDHLQSAANANEGVQATMNLAVDTMARFKGEVDRVLGGHPATEEIIGLATSAQESMSQTTAATAIAAELILLAVTELSALAERTKDVANQLGGAR